MLVSWCGPLKTGRFILTSGPLLLCVTWSVEENLLEWNKIFSCKRISLNDRGKAGQAYMNTKYRKTRKNWKTYKKKRNKRRRRTMTTRRKIWKKRRTIYNGWKRWDGIAYRLCTCFRRAVFSLLFTDANARHDSRIRAPYKSLDSHPEALARRFLGRTPEGEVNQMKTWRASNLRQRVFSARTSSLESFIWW